MDLSPNGAAFLRGHEGFVSRYYLDPVGIGTIGIGFTWASSAFRLWWAKNKPNMKFGPGATMTRAEAEFALQVLVAAEYGAAVAKHYGKPVPQHVYDQGCSTVFNCGAGTLGDNWAAEAKSERYPRAAEFLKTTRVTAKGKKLLGLMRRRAEEAILLRDGVYTGVTAKAAPIIVDAMADGMLVRREAGPAVAQLIADLHLLGFYDGALDDVFGFGTEAAVLDFQRAKGIEADGYAGPKTLAAISAAVKAQMPKPSPTVPIAVVPATEPAPIPEPVPVAVPEPAGGFWAALIRIVSLFSKKG